MYNRKKRLFLTAVCLSLGLLTGCNVGDTKNYKQAAQDLEQGNYEAALEEYETAISEGVKPAQSYRGAGVAKLKLGNYEEAITYFNDALKCDKVGKALKKDILSYRAVAYLKVKDYEAALEDCQTLAENYKMDADLYFLTGETALAMDSYEEASANFEQAYGEDATYDRAIQIYGAYLNRDMEADGTRYLEAALSGTAKNAEDHCDRGRVYYYMDDYENAESELKQAIDGDNTEALVLLGMVYMDKGDSTNTFITGFLCKQSCHRAVHSAAHCDNCFSHFYSILFCDPITRNIIVYDNFIYVMIAVLQNTEQLHKNHLYSISILTHLCKIKKALKRAFLFYTNNGVE